MVLSIHSRLFQATPTLCAVALSLALSAPFFQAYAQDSGSLPDGVAAVVNGEPIPILMIDVVEAQFASQEEKPSREDILEQLIDLEVLTQHAEERKLEATPNTAASLQLQYAQTMANAYLETVSEESPITDDEMQAEYDSQIESLEHSEYRASHILVDSKADGLKVIESLQTGSDFAELAKEFSTGPSAESGGDLGWFDTQTMVPEFTEAVKLLAKNEYTAEPIQTQFGWHVIFLVDTRAATVPDFETVKEGIRNLMTRNRLNERVAELREQANVER